MNNQKGFTLVVALILLAILAVLGVTLMSSGVTSQKTASVKEQDAVAFHAAETANGSYKSSYHYGTEHIFKTAEDAYWDDLAAPKFGYTRCVDDKGRLVDCGTKPRVESDQLVKSKVEAFYHNCETAALKCLGNSWDDKGLGCHSFQMIGEGHLDISKDDVADTKEARTHVEEWVRIVRSCNKSL
ncbi:PilX N-terminal domain-containing pilus assembly protein [Kangiella shandongensis]|uniref:PilX N-terminal domain-containing pilus assembly protein n=1 Tax=Kangiella shandongensis TaxID=2763258 RepID=UPI001CC091E2|nr:PilX N-terminal domain-containing pilus assembly protein [Kangiella shandongensis]